MRGNARAIHGSRFLVYAIAGGLLAAAAGWAAASRALGAREGADVVTMQLEDAPACARFREAGAPVAGMAPCTVGLGRMVLKCEGDPDCSKATSARTWTYRPARWLQKRWAATPSPRPTPTVTPRPTASPRPTEVDACRGGCMVYDFALRKASCLRPCPE